MKSWYILHGTFATLPKDTAEGHCWDINRLISFISTYYIFDFMIDTINDWNNDIYIVFPNAICHGRYLKNVPM